ncbi:hypothetical protein WCE41_06545 [Luteimonas sp. MJ246]|uniref:hypothetical protein n=1 Tax=Luteimonas sp. MJ174 TaxID=3129237 RepID=UPI0031BB628D
MNLCTCRSALAWGLFACSVAFALAGCARDEGVAAGPGAGQPPVTSAPPPAPRASLEPDTANAPIERAAPPTLQPVALGRFVAADRVATAMTGALEIEDSRIRGDNGALFVTERVAIVRGGDEFSAGQRYADMMMIDARHPVELRRVLDETRADDGQGFCGSMKTGFLALASYVEQDMRVVKLIALQGDGIPAAAARDTELCAAASYESGA